MSIRNRFAWSLAVSAAFIAVPAMAQDAEWDRDGHFDGVYIQGAGGIALNGENGSSFSFDTNRDGNYGETVTTTSNANAFGPGFCNGGANGRDRAAGCRKDKAGVDYAVRVGFDKRAGNIVFGGLIEGSDNEMKERSSAFSTTPAAYRIDREMRYAISARARVGYTPGGGALFYATGGASYAKINHDFSTTNTANSFTENGDGKMVWGYQAGGGTEIMVTNNISLGLEYLYSRYKDNKYTVAVGAGTANPLTNPFLLNGGGTNLRLTDKYLDTHSLRGTIGFRF